MMNLKPKIINHQTELNNKIVYVVEVHDQVNQKKKITKLRYSQFKEIHQELEVLAWKLKLHVILPDFPGRKFLGTTNKNEDAIYERKKDLTIAQYLCNLLAVEKLYSLDIMKKYFIPTEKVSSLQEETNMQICIDRYTLVEDVVIYYVRLRDLNSHEEWTYKSRYSELRNLHEALTHSKVKDLPDFPKKKIFGITNESPEDIEKRREALQSYFNGVFGNKEIFNNDAVKFFIEQSKKQAKRDRQLDAMKRKKSGKK